MCRSLIGLKSIIFFLQKRWKHRNDYNKTFKVTMSTMENSLFNQPKRFDLKFNRHLYQRSDIVTCDLLSIATIKVNKMPCLLRSYIQNECSNI